jgi:hypothetical protein
VSVEGYVIAEGLQTLTPNRLTQLVYIHDIGARAYFLSNQQQNARTTSSTTAQLAYAFSTNISTPEIIAGNFPNTTWPVRLSNTWTAGANMYAAVFGHGAYVFSSPVLWSAVHAGVVPGYYERVFYVTIATCPPRRYYAATLNGVPSFYSNQTVPHLCFMVGPQPEPLAVLDLLPQNGITTALNMSIDTLAKFSNAYSTPVLIGTGAYGTSSDLTLATFHYGLLQFNGVATTYITEVVQHFCAAVQSDWHAVRHDVLPLRHGRVAGCDAHGVGAP